MANMDFSGRWWAKNGELVMVTKIEENDKYKTRFPGAVWIGVCLRTMVALEFDGGGNCLYCNEQIKQLVDYNLDHRVNPQSKEAMG